MRVGARVRVRVRVRARVRVRPSRALTDEAVEPRLIAAEALHDEEVVELIPLLLEVRLLELGRAAPPAEGLVEEDHRVVREVRDARHRLEVPG